jgi:hypothetical protein
MCVQHNTRILNYLTMWNNINNNNNNNNINKKFTEIN